MSMKKIHQRKWLRLVFTLLAVALCLPAHADGEKREVDGAKWVKPVEFLEMGGKKGKTSLENAFWGGFLLYVNIDSLTKAKGVQVIGMKLKPRYAAGHMHSMLGALHAKFEVEDQFGNPISGESFCVYRDDKGINRNYSVDYDFVWSAGFDGFSPKGKMEIHSSLALKDLRMVQTGKGIGFHYAMDCHYTADGEMKELENVIRGEWKSTPQHKESTSSKAAGVVDSLAFFSFDKDGQYVKLILMGNESIEEYFGGNNRYAACKWMVLPHVCFEVEEILIGDPDALSGEERIIQTQYLSDLLKWLNGEGDPLDLGEHTDATTSAVINMVGMLLALLLGGIGGMSGMGIVPLSPPPPVPQVPSELPPPPPPSPVSQVPSELLPPPPPPDPNAFRPEDYPYGDQFLSQQPNGDIVMKSPATGKDVHYYSNGDGTWFSDSGMTYHQNDIAERLRYEAENAGVLKQDAETAARNVAEQRAQWDAQNQRDLERGYSDEMKGYRDWKAEQERAEQKQAELERLAEKYHVAADEKAVRSAIKWEKLMNEIDRRTYMAEADAWGEKEKYLDKVDKAAEIGVNVLSSVTPGGSQIKNAYTFAKSTLVGVSEAVAKGKSGLEAARHVAVRMGEGALGVIQNEAGNLSGSWKGEYGITVGTEFLKSGMKEYNDSGGDLGKALKAGLSGVGSSTVSFGISKGVSIGFKTLKEGSKDYVEYAKKGLVPEGDASYKIMSKLDKFLNGETALKGDLKIGKKVTSYDYDLKTGNAKDAKEVFSIFKMGNVKDAANASFSKVGTSKGFAISINESISNGDLAEAVVNETLSQVKFGEGDDAKNIFELTGGQYGEDVYNFGKEIAQLSQTAAKYAKAKR